MVSGIELGQVLESSPPSFIFSSFKLLPNHIPINIRPHTPPLPSTNSKTHSPTMPEPLKPSEVNSQTDPTVAKQWDSEAPTDLKFRDLYTIADKLSICLLGTLREGTGPVHRSMAVAKRSGPDFLFLGNAHSQKFTDIEKNPDKVTVTFQNSSTQDWISVTGKAVVSSHEDERVGKVWNQGVKAWFGDLGDGVHDGSPKDPRMKLIEVQAACE